MRIVKNAFLGIASVKKTHAATMFTSVTSNLEEINVLINSSLLYKKLVAFASDGASVMTGWETVHPDGLDTDQHRTYNTVLSNLLTDKTKEISQDRLMIL